MTEQHKFTTSDGVDYVFDNVERWVLVPSPGNWGIPPLNVITERGYKQDKTTVVATYLNPRTLDIQFRLQGCGRDEFWTMRNTILDIARPDRGVLTYTHTREDYVKRSIQGYPTSPSFPAIDTDLWDEWAIGDVFQMTCYDPTWYNPDVVTAAIVHTSPDPNLIFPFDFPTNAFFGSGVDLYEAQFTYTGTWYTYPVFTIHGAALNTTLQHEELGIQIVLQGLIASNETVVIDLANQTAVSDIEGDVWNRLWIGSNIVDFKIWTAPTVAGAINTLQVIVDNADSNTAVSIQFNERFIGI